MTKFHTLSEIQSQTAAWKQALDITRSHAGRVGELTSGDYDQVVFSGCGSTYYLSLAAAALFQELTRRVAEYTDLPGSFDEFCRQSNQLGFSTILKHRDLDACLETCPDSP